MREKTGWTVAAIVSLLTGLCLRDVDLLDTTPAGIEVEQREFSVKADSGVQSVMIDVPLVNRSAAQDRLVGMKSSCLCVTTAHLPHEILPGESWDLPLRVDSSNYSPGDSFVFELTLFLESGSAVPVQIDFLMTDCQSSDSIGFDKSKL